MKRGRVVNIFCSTFTDVPETVQQKDINEAEITLKWIEPEHNGANITQHSTYQRIANDEQWARLAMITNTTETGICCRSGERRGV